MTTASASQSRPTPKQNVPGGAPRATRSDPAATARNLRPVPLLVAAGGAEDDEFRMNMADLPRLSTGLEVDGFQPSLVSRLLDLIDRLRRR